MGKKLECLLHRTPELCGSECGRCGWEKAEAAQRDEMIRRGELTRDTMGRMGLKLTKPQA